MNHKKKIAIVLGGTAPHKALIENLKKRGYYTVLIDYYENPPAKNVADEHLRESTLDQEKVLEIAKKLSASLVISTSIDQANVTACYVAEKLGLPKPYSYETALNVTNKGLMKKMMLDNGIPTAKYFFVRDSEELTLSGVKLPLIIKPADSNGSAGVRKADNVAQLNDYLEKATSLSRSSCAIVEEFKTGIEISADCFILNGRVDLLLIRQKYKLPYVEGGVLQSPGSFSPGLVGPINTEKLKKIIGLIGTAFSLNNTPIIVQALINEDEINIIEFAPRVGGGLSYRTVLLNTNFDILNSGVNSFLGINELPEYNEPNSYLATVIVYARPGVFDRIEGVESLIEKGVMLEYHAYKTKGMVIGDDMSTKSRVGAFIVKADTLEEKIDKIKEAVRSLKVFSEKGEDLLIKDIYSDIENQTSVS